MAGPESNGQHPDPGIRLVLGELRELRLEMRADRQHADEERRRTDEERQRTDEERRRTDEEWRQERRQADEERRRVDEEWRQEKRQADELWQQERTQSNERFQQLLRDFREDSARREAATQKAFKEAFKDVRTVGLSIVKTLNRHTRILERIERKLGTGGHWRPGQGNGRGA